MSKKSPSKPKNKKGGSDHAIEWILSMSTEVSMRSTPSREVGKEPRVLRKTTPPTKTALAA